MRLLIAAGGTGGHIYPALAVAQSLRAGADRHDAPELRWLGGHRGLEAQLPAELAERHIGDASHGRQHDWRDVRALASLASEK